MKKILYSLLLFPLFAGALEFDRIFQSGMVLQRGMPLQVSGKAAPGEKVTLSFAGHTVSGTAAKNGRWQLKLPVLQASKENRSMVLQGKDKKITLGNVLVGEVWFCSGQSNMYWPLSRCLDAQKVIEKSTFPQIRTLRIGAWPAKVPQESFKAVWQELTPQNAGSLSGVGYYFARELHQTLDIPIGLICAVQGGTMIEPWTPRGAWDAYPEIKPQVERVYKKVPGLKKPRLQDQPQNQPHVLFNSAVHPARHFTCRGVIWYQGCSNIWNDTEDIYVLKQKALLESWKKAFNAPELKFYFVQLAPLERPAKYRPMHTAIWLAQQRFADSDKNVKMAVINDVGDLKNIHPANKEPVGKRLAAFALKYDYGKKVKADFPRPEKYELRGSTVILSFSHASGWKTTDGKAVRNFELAGSDGKFYPAQVRISGKTLEISAAQVKNPQVIRYMFHSNKMGNLISDAGLPPGIFELKIK